MKWLLPAILVLLLGATGWVLASSNVDPANILTGDKAFEGYPDLKPGTFRKITVDALPKPASGVANFGGIVGRPADACPKAPQRFKRELYFSSLNEPREIRTAPNGDMFLAESNKGEIKIFRGISKEGKPEQ